MPFTVITLKKVPAALRGDLTKWMQEISVGVYVGNFNSRIRENLWKRVCEDTESGEATLSYMCHNEIGYNFETKNTDRQVIDYDGIPLVMVPLRPEKESSSNLRGGFSKASKFHQAKKYASTSIRPKDSGKKPDVYVTIDVETTGLDEEQDQLLEVGAVKSENGVVSTFQEMIRIEGTVPQTIFQITGITTQEMQENGHPLKEVLERFCLFIQDCDLVGYNIKFDVKFINAALKQIGCSSLKNQTHDLMQTVKREKLFQRDYKLQTSLHSYGIDAKVPHRALEDAKLVYQLSLKVNKF